MYFWKVGIIVMLCYIILRFGWLYIVIYLVYFIVVLMFKYWNFVIYKIWNMICICILMCIIVIKLVLYCK